MLSLMKSLQSKVKYAGQSVELIRLTLPEVTIQQEKLLILTKLDRIEKKEVSAYCLNSLGTQCKKMLWMPEIWMHSNSYQAN